MYKNKHQNKLNFNYILEECKKRYEPFNKYVEVKRKPANIITAIKNAKKRGKNAIISEVKYRSPTKKNSIKGAPEDIAVQMIRGGACAISVLTEPVFFGGSLENLKKIKKISGDVPILRKDFLFHQSQIPESYYYGADSLLLISSFFTIQKLKSMIDYSRSFGMEPLVEVHSAGDIKKAMSSGAKLFVVNNRDKNTLQIDIHRTTEMCPKIKGVRVSASGIENTAQLREVLNCADAALIGTSIMASDDISSKVAEFVEVGQ